VVNKKCKTTRHNLLARIDYKANYFELGGVGS